MELRHLRYFAAVAAHGSFSRAANQLHLTQPALSRQVKSLEDEIGVALIVRGQNTISLTSAGEDFYEEAGYSSPGGRRDSKNQDTPTGGEATHWVCSFPHCRDHAAGR